MVSVLPSRGSFFMDTFFKKRTPVFGTKVDVDFVKGGRRISPFVNPKSAAKTVGKIGYKTNTFETPLLKPKDVTTIEDLSVRMPGENVYSSITREQRALEMVTQKLVEFNDMNMRREEWMAASLLFTGKIPVIGEGLNYEIDFNFTNKEALTDTKWSAEGSDPLADIERWILACQKEGSRTPNICVMSRDAYNAFINHPKVIDKLDSKNMTVAIIQPNQLTENVTYGGTLVEYNMSIYIYNEWYIDDWTNPASPLEKSLVPAKTVLLASSNASFEVYYGELTIADANAASGFASVVGEKVADSWVEKDPAARYLALHSRPLTVGHEVDSWYVATVL
jgi:hypothetical protein